MLVSHTAVQRLEIPGSATLQYDKRFERWNDHLPPERLGATYDRIGWNTWRAIFRRDLLDLIGCFDNPNIVDVGCFRGDFLDVLLTQTRPFDYTGVDVTPKYIHYAATRFNSRAYDACARGQIFSFHEGNAFGLQFPDGFFDLTVFTGVLHHLPEVLRPLREVCRVTRSQVLLGDYVHSGPEDEIATIKSGFLYKTWSKEFLERQIAQFGKIQRITTAPSPDYDYRHASIIVAV